MPLDASIIITSYNVERYIGWTVESALAQQNVTFEIILVDDCSSDATWQLISAMDDPRIRSFRMEHNSGPGAARNRGFAEAQGEWIVVLDGDDAMAPERVSRCIATARASQAQLVVDNVTVVREADGKEFPMFEPRAFAEMRRLGLECFIRSTFPSAGGYTLGYLKPIFSAAYLRAHQLRYRAELRIGEDYSILAEALALGAVCAVEASAGYHYTVRAGSISHRLSLESIRAMQAANQEFSARFTLDAATMNAQAKRAAWFDEQAAYAMLIAALKQRSLRNAVAAIRRKPTAVRHLWEPMAKRLKAIFA